MIMLLLLEEFSIIITGRFIGDGKAKTGSGGVGVEKFLQRVGGTN